MNKKLIFADIYLMLNKKSFQFSFLVVLLFCCANYVYNAISCLNGVYSDFDAVQVLFIGSYMGVLNNNFFTIYPFILVFPFAYSYVTDYLLHSNCLIISRTNKKDYIMAQAITSFLGGFILIFIPFLFNLIITLISFPLNGLVVNESQHSYNNIGSISGDAVFIHTKYPGMLFGQLYLEHPVLYMLAYIVFLSFITGVASFFVYSLSFYIKKYRILLLLPFYLIISLLASLKVFILYKSNNFIEVSPYEYWIIDFIYGKTIWFPVILYGILLSIGLISVMAQIRKDEVI